VCSSFLESVCSVEGYFCLCGNLLFFGLLLCNLSVLHYGSFMVGLVCLPRTFRVPNVDQNVCTCDVLIFAVIAWIYNGFRDLEGVVFTS